jgi:UDP-N-acetylmuramate--alanine ligase
MQIKDFKKVYFIGIKGAGMAAVAQILKSRGLEISGSDTTEIFYTDAILKRFGIKYFEGFAEQNIPEDVDLVVHSTSYSMENNCEMQKAAQRKLKMLSYPEMLGLLFQEKLGIAVCGTHGKTTTSAMLGEALKAAGVDPSAIIGSQVIAWQGCALNGKGEYFVAEADEYQNKLQYYQPWSAVLTSVDWDHPDFFPNFEIYKAAFKDFVKKIPKVGHLVVWGDSVDTLEVAAQANCQILTYGFGEDNLYKISNLVAASDENDVQTFQISYKEKNLGNFQTPLTGKHNVLNATAVIALAHAMNLDLEKIKNSLQNFSGTSRRFETLGKFGEAILIDDYAHHPDEIKATLAGAKARFLEKKIWTVFHPHTFTRTKALLEDFAQSFDDCDRVVIIDVYGSAREQQGGVSSQDLVDLINKYTFGKAQYLATIEQATEYFREKSGEYDVLITMGAGDVWKIADKLKS